LPQSIRDGVKKRRISCPQEETLRWFDAATQFTGLTRSG